MRAVLIRLDAADHNGNAYPLFLSNTADTRASHIDGEEWIPALTRLPRLRYDFFGGAFTNQIVRPQSDFTVSVRDIQGLFARDYSSARVRIWQGEVGTPLYEYALKFDGRISDEPAVEGGRATFNAAPADEWLDELFLSVFEGTGGIEGPDDLTGQEKPRVFGNVRFAPGVLINAVDVVYMVNDGPVEAVNAVYDRAARLGATSGDFADLAALLAADIPAGGWGTCLALGLVRLGAPADGKVAFDVSGDNAGGYVRTAGEIIGRVAAITSGAVNAGNLAQLDDARPFDLQVSVSTQTTARQIIQGIADSVGAVAGMGWDGKLFAQALDIGEPAFTLAMDGSGDYPLIQASARIIGAPFSRLATRAEPTYVVHGQEEVATGFVIRGEYSAEREYRLDDLVYTADGRAFAYVNETPRSGNAPPDYPDTANAYWSIEGAADSTAQAQITLNEVLPFVVQADSDGVTTTALPLTRVVRLLRGGVPITSGVTVGTVVASGGIAASTSVSSGDVTVSLSTANANGTVTVPLIFDGVTYTKIIPINRTVASEQVGGGAGGTEFVDYTLTNVDSTTYAAASDADAIVQSDGSGELQFLLSGSYEGDGVMQVKAQYSSDNSTWSDVTGSETTGSAAEPGGLEGFVSLIQTQTGLSATTDYFVRLLARRTAAGGTLSWSYPTFRVKQP